MSGAAGLRSWVPLAVAAAVPVLVLVLDAARGRGLFDEGAPVLDGLSVVRSLALIVAVVALLAAVQRAAEGHVPTPWPPWARPAIVVTLVLTLAATALTLLDPVTYSRLAQEDGTVENLTALLFGVGGVALLMVAMSRSRGEHGLLRWAAGIMGVAFIFSAGEEISWGQRILGFGTPELLSENLQHEANLHNLATDPLEAAFYSGCAMLFILLPFVLPRTGVSPRLGRLARLAPLVPAPWIVVAAAPSAAMNLDMWDVVPVQLTVWATLGILAVVAVERRRAGDPGWRLVALTLGLTAAVQVVAFTASGSLDELYDVTEYKEFALGLVAAMYGLDLLVRRRSLAVSRSDSPTRRSPRG